MELALNIISFINFIISCFFLIVAVLYLIKNKNIFLTLQMISLFALSLIAIPMLVLQILTEQVYVVSIVRIVVYGMLGGLHLYYAIKRRKRNKGIISKETTSN